MDAKVEIIFMIQNIFYVKLFRQIDLPEYIGKEILVYNGID
jgi:hypothetical protein